MSADQGGEVLLPHFINHYHQLGITYRRMLILVHHDPDRSRESLERIATICHGYMLECRFWEEPFSVEGQYREHLKMLKDFVYDPYDWILYANVNEFHDWEGNIKCVLLVVFFSLLIQVVCCCCVYQKTCFGGSYACWVYLFRYAVEKANRKRAYYITGPYVDRFSGDFRAISVPAMSDGRKTGDVFDTFPVRCPSPEIIDRYTDPDAPPATQPYGEPIGHHPGSKVVAFRNSMRVTRLRDGVLSPDEAKVYLSNCSTIEPHLCPRMSLDGPPEDLYHLTPYAMYQSQYRYKDTPLKEEIGINITLWHALEWAGIQVPIHRIDWAKEVLSKHREWLERYKGTCTVERQGAQLQQCSPLLASWHEKARMYHDAVSGRQMKVSEMCDRGRLLGFDTNTLDMGLAWEEFETSLKVVSKVRNSIKGDSRTRLENIKKKIHH